MNYKPDLMGTQPRLSKLKSGENTSVSLLEMCKPEDTAPEKLEAQGINTICLRPYQCVMPMNKTSTIHYNKTITFLEYQHLIKQTDNKTKQRKLDDPTEREFLSSVE